MPVSVFEHTFQLHDLKSQLTRESADFRKNQEILRKTEA